MDGSLFPFYNLDLEEKESHKFGGSDGIVRHFTCVYALIGGEAKIQCELAANLPKSKLHSRFPAI